MASFKKILITVLSVLVLVGILEPSWGQDKRGKDSSASIRFGTLPVVQALPIFVASEKGYFAQQGIHVELIPFNSALDKDVALTVREISGYFGDMMTPMVLRGNGVPVKILATIFNTPVEQRMFAILAAPKLSEKTWREMCEGAIAVSSNTIIEYITTKILISHGCQIQRVNMIETKNIPIRLQMLLSGQVPFATLPEPLATLAEMKGAHVMADDAGKGFSATIVAFRSEFLEGNSKAVKGFLAAIDRAASFINRNPEEARAIMNRNCRVPKPLEQNFAIPRFPGPMKPEQSQVLDIYRWLREKGILRSDMKYQEMVSDGFLP